ncbi:MAG TPA: hypothetical protein DIT74_08270 [Pseudoalteromonas sp.]|nr:hypothetical protein B1F84_07475 [Pseudoalteromonas sp. DL-6]HCP97699.1 hypothetical protein [Pseudoalteromonas sp.]
MSGFMAGIIYLNTAIMRPAGNKKAMLNMAFLKCLKYLLLCFFTRQVFAVVSSKVDYFTVFNFPNTGSN